MFDIKLEGAGSEEEECYDFSSIPVERLVETTLVGE